MFISNHLHSTYEIRMDKNLINKPYSLRCKHFSVRVVFVTAIYKNLSDDIRKCRMVMFVSQFQVLIKILRKLNWKRGKNNQFFFLYWCRRCILSQPAIKHIEKKQ